MIVLYIIGILLFFIEICLLKCTTSVKAVERDSIIRGMKYYEPSEEAPFEIKLWMLILLIIGNIGPISFLTAGVFTFIFVFNQCRSRNEAIHNGEFYWEFHSKLVDRLIGFLNKRIL